VSQPLAAYDFTLAADDALAWEALPREKSGRLKAGLLGTLIAGGFAAGMLPDEWTEGWGFVLVAIGLVLVVFGGATVALTFGNHRRAQRRFPQAVTVHLEDWGDSLTVREGDKVQHLALESIVAAVQGSAHLFLATGGEPVILPRRAFEPAVLEALSLRVEEAGADPLDH
jgi:hypothetical protein